MRLGIDLDGVVANFNAGWMRRYNAEYGTDLKPEMVHSWDAFVPLTRFDTNAEFWEWHRMPVGAACSVTCLSIQMHSKVSPD